VTAYFYLATKPQPLACHNSPGCHPWSRSSCFAKQNLELLDPRIHIKVMRDHLFMNGSSGQEKPLFFFEKQLFSSPRMTTWNR
jgi:hypothetical protein